MKSIILSLVFLIAAASAQVSTFGGKKAEWGWSGKGFSEAEVIKILEANWGKVNPLELQALADAGSVSVEFLWKISSDLVGQADSSGSTFIVGNCKVDSVVITLQTSGKGEIRLFQNGSLVGRARCHSAAKREGEYSQPEAGFYRAGQGEKMHVSGDPKLKGAKMPYAIPVDASTGKYMHCGELSPSHGCIRVSEPVQKQLFTLIPQGTSVKIVHE